jgi:hypothetical protein
MFKFIEGNVILLYSFAKMYLSFHNNHKYVFFYKTGKEYLHPCTTDSKIIVLCVVMYTCTYELL